MQPFCTQTQIILAILGQEFHLLSLNCNDSAGPSRIIEVTANLALSLSLFLFLTTECTLPVAHTRVRMSPH